MIVVRCALSVPQGSIPRMDPNRPAIHALAAAIAVVRASHGVPGPAPSATQVAAVVDRPEPLVVPAAWLDNDDVDLTFVPLRPSSAA